MALYSLLIDFLHNIALTFVLLFLFSIVRPHISKRLKYLRECVMALLFGFAAISSMQFPLAITDGVFVDSRLIIMSLSGALGGPVSAAVCALAIGGYRLFVGGAGALPALATIIAAGLAGTVVFLASRRQKVSLQFWHFVILGFATVAVAMLGTLLLKPEMWSTVIGNSWLAITIIYPVGTVTIGLLFRYQERRDDNEQTIKKVNQKLEELVTRRTGDLSRSEKSLRLILDSLPDAIFIHDVDGRIVEVNQKMLDMYEIKALSEVIGASPMKFSAPGVEIDLILEQLSKSSTNSPITFEWECQTLMSHTRFPVEVCLNQIDYQGATHALAVVRDISARKAASAELQKYQLHLEDLVKERSSELMDVTERLQMATKYSNMGIWDWDIPTNKLVWDETMYRIFGVSKSQFSGQYESWLKTIIPEDAAAADSAVKQALQNNREFATEFRIKWHDKSIHHIKAFGRAVQDANGKPVRMVGINYDISDLKRAEAELTQERNVAQSYLDIAEVILVAFNDKAEVSLLNRKGYQVLGYDRGELDGKNWFKLCLPAEAYEETYGAYLQIMKGDLEPVEYFENDVLTKSGEKRFIGWHNTFLKDSNGQIVGTLSSGEDITERRNAEEQLRLHRENLEEQVNKRTAELKLARDAADAANEAKSLFLANMSHEIRTPMNAVLGFAQLLTRDETLSDDGHKKVATIIKSGEHLLAIISDILEMSRIEAGRTEVRLQIVDLYELLDDLTVIFRQRAEDKGLILTSAHDEKLPRFIATDLDKLRQILSNLIGNAIKFTKAGAITIHAFRVGPERYAIRVEDTGIGIPAEERERLFQPFERTHTGKYVASGTGLGLAISQKYAKMLGGDIQIMSKTDAGSSFQLEFSAPATQKGPIASVRTQRLSRLKPGQGEIRILIVDDLEANRELLRGVLEPAGFTVEDAKDGDEAIEMVDAQLPRIILMDLRMPGKDGFEVTRTLRRKYPGKQLIIIGISASAFEKEKLYFLASGLNDFIAKPFREEELFDSIATHADIQFETPDEQNRQNPTEQISGIPSLKNAPAAWIVSFNQAVAQGNITRLRRLGEEAREFDTVLSASVVDRAMRYDLDGLKVIGTTS